MNICFPVSENLGTESLVFDHFGSAPLFLVVDSESGLITEQLNRDLGHTHGSCQPLKALAGKQVDAIVVGGIGGGALAGLNRVGLKVYLAQPGTLAKNLAALSAGQLQELTPGLVCGGHGSGHGHGHSHGAGRGAGCGC